jgi:prepilin-type N-terminal cleavage/methylation domain-containing protein
MKIHRHKAFTLAEILVVMVIITFIGIAASRLNFSRLSLNEKLNIEVLKINNIFQEVKNNSLIGR